MDACFWIAAGIAVFYLLMIPVVKQGRMLRVWREEWSNDATAVSVWLFSPLVIPLMLLGWAITNFGDAMEEFLTRLNDWLEPKKGEK